MIKLPIEIGDILLVGRFKNKRIKVKEIGTDEHGLPTVNGRGILKIRIEKLMEPKKQIKENVLYPELQSGSKIKVRKDDRSGIFIDGVVTDRKGNYISYKTSMGFGGINLEAKNLGDTIQFDSLKENMKKNLKEDHTNRPGKHFKNIRNLDYDVDTQDGVKIAKYIDKENYFKHKNLLPGGYPFNVDKLNSINKENSNIISVSGVYVDNRAFSRAFKKQELEKILNKKLNYIDPDRKIKENMKKQIKESIDYDETEVNPSFLIKDNEYVWIMGAEPLLVYYTGRGKKPGTYNFEFKDKKGNHDLSRRDVKEYIKYKEGSAPGPFGYNSGLNKFKMKESNNDTKLKTSIPQANKNDKFLLYRHKSNSPSPGHDEYLFTSGNTLDELFDNWIEVMRRGGYGYSGSELERQKSLFQKDKLKYWSRPASFYTLKTKRKSDLDQLKMDRDHRRSMASKGYDDDPRESKQFKLATVAKNIIK